MSQQSKTKERLLSELEKLQRRVSESRQGYAQIRQTGRRLQKLVHCLVKLGVDPKENAGRLTELCGELLGADWAVYARLDRGLLHTWGQWSAPHGYSTVERPGGRVCYELIRRGGDRPLVIKDLPQTSFAETDPDMIRLGARTLVGQAVTVEGTAVGCLALLYIDDFVPEEEDRELVRLFALAIEGEERRKRSGERGIANEPVPTAVSSGTPLAITYFEEGALKWANDAALKMFATETEQHCLGRSVTEFYSTFEEYTRVREIFFQSIEEDGHAAATAQLRRSDGSVFTGYVRMSPLDRSNPRKGLVVTFSDLSPKEDVEEPPQRTEESSESLPSPGEPVAREFARIALDSFPFPVYVLDATDYSVKIANTAAAALGDGDNGPCYRMTRGLDKPCHGPDRPCPIETVKRTGRPVTVDHISQDSESRRRVVQVHAYPIFDAEGNVELIAELLRDVTEAEHATEASSARENEFQTIFETARECVYIKDRTGRYTHVNPAMGELFELPSSQLVGKTDSDLFGQEIGRQLSELDDRVLGGEPVEIEQTRPVSQERITFLDAREPIVDSSGEVIGLSGIARDITDRRTERISFLRPRADLPSRAARWTIARAGLAANSDEGVLILGEIGSGKDSLARYIHERSRRRNGPFYVFKCAAGSEREAESGLFGHEPGAFEGAKTRKRGLIEVSEGGTLLLNEVGKLSPRLQSKLAAFLSTGRLHRAGGAGRISSNTRIMAASRSDLQGQVATGRFRDDLFSLLSAFTLEIPPLRKRTEDIPVIARDMLGQIASKMGLGRAPELDDEAVRQLEEYHWPGNIRELRTVLERAVMVSREGQAIRIPRLTEEELSDWSIEVHFPRNRSVHAVADSVKRSLAVEALRRAEGKRQDAASLLGISRHAFLRLTKAVGLDE